MARKSETRKAKKSTVDLDFTDVEARSTHPEGEYAATVESVEMKTSEKSDSEYLNWKFKTKKGSVFYVTSLQTQSLWNLRNLLEALGVDVPNGPMELDLDEMVDMELKIVVSHELYEGKNRARVTDLMPLDGKTDDDDDEEKVKVEEGDDALEKLTEDEVRDMDDDELDEVNEKYELGLKLEKFKTTRKKAGAVIDALEEKDYIED